jgi:hypothetical protein
MVTATTPMTTAIATMTTAIATTMVGENSTTPMPPIRSPTDRATATIPPGPDILLYYNNIRCRLGAVALVQDENERNNEQH